LQKKPSTSELLDWVQALAVGGIKPDRIYEELPFLGTLLKKNQDFDVILRRAHNQGKGVNNQPSGARMFRNW